MNMLGYKPEELDPAIQRWIDNCPVLHCLLRRSTHPQLKSFDFIEKHAGATKDMMDRMAIRSLRGWGCNLLEESILAGIRPFGDTQSNFQNPDSKILKDDVLEIFV